MDLLTLEQVSLVAIALIYMIFDVFNKRNIPNVVVYASLAYGILIALVSFSSLTWISFCIAAMILGFGYLIYKIGQLGAADIFEFAVLSLIMPFQTVYYTLGATQLPFILAVLINTGVVALILVPIYYIPKGYIVADGLIKTIDKKDFFKAIVLGATYLFFIGFLVFAVGIDLLQFTLVTVLMLCSIAIVLFEKLITRSMVQYIKVGGFDGGDIIAVNLMSQKDVAKAKRDIKAFGRLVTDDLINEMKEKHIRTEFPVYKKAMPLAVAIFAAVLLALTVGNLLLFILMPA